MDWTKYDQQTKAIKDKYEGRVIALLTRIKNLVEANGYQSCEPFDMHDTDYNWHIVIEGENLKGTISIDFTIEESKEMEGSDDGIAFALHIIAEGGQVLGDMTPNNYSPELWIALDKPEEIEKRFLLFEQMYIEGVLPLVAKAAPESAERGRLEELRKALRAENISYGELAELQSLVPYIDKDDVELLEAAGVPEQSAQTESQDAKPVTDVIFRVWRGKEYKGDVIALFPAEPEDAQGRYCSSYEHVGQHSGADYTSMIERTRPAKPEEYADLKEELESEPYRYNLRVCQRQTAKHRREFDLTLKAWLTRNQDSSVTSTLAEGSDTMPPRKPKAGDLFRYEGVEREIAEITSLYHIPVIRFDQNKYVALDALAWDSGLGAWYKKPLTDAPDTTRIEELQKVLSEHEISLANGATPQRDDEGKIKVEPATCGGCGETWNDALITGRTPAPGARCPYESIHEEIAEYKRLTGKPKAFPMGKFILYECGICSCYHPWNFKGDCRDDKNRFGTPEDFLESVGLKDRDGSPDVLEVRTMEERVAADSGETLDSSINTAEMEERIAAAARKALHIPNDQLRTVFEHGHWWITNNDTGEQWSVEDASGPGSTDGFDFEKVSGPDQSYL